MEWVAKNTSPSHVRISRNPFSAWNTHNHAFTLFISCLFDITWRAAHAIAAGRARADRSRASAFLARRPSDWGHKHALAGSLSHLCGVPPPDFRADARLLAGPVHSRPHETRFWLGGRTRFCRIAQQWRATPHNLNLPFSHRHRFFFLRRGTLFAVKYCPTKILINLWEKKGNKDYLADSFVGDF